MDFQALLRQARQQKNTNLTPINLSPQTPAHTKEANDELATFKTVNLLEKHGLSAIAYVIFVLLFSIRISQ